MCGLCVCCVCVCVVCACLHLVSMHATVLFNLMVSHSLACTCMLTGFLKEAHDDVSFHLHDAICNLLQWFQLELRTGNEGIPGSSPAQCEAIKK